MPKTKAIALAFLLILFLASSAKAQGSKEKVYVWDFTASDGKQNELTGKFTSEFEEALIQGKCYQVLERRQIDRLVSHIKNEQTIADLNAIPQKSREELKKITDAQIVIFGRVDDDIDSGLIKITVSFQHFDSAKDVKSIQLPRGKRLDPESREKAMKELVDLICKSKPSPQPSSAPVSPVTMRELFEKDLVAPNRQTMGSKVTITLNDFPNERLEFHVRVFLDIDAKAKFIAYYIPGTTHTYRLCQIILAEYNKHLAEWDFLGVRASPRGARPIEYKEIKEVPFTGLIYIYHDTILYSPEINSLTQLFQDKGVEVRFRGMDYHAEKSKPIKE